MVVQEKPSREQQIALMTNTQQRMAERLSTWIVDDEVKAALHRHDRGQDLDRPLKCAVA